MLAATLALNAQTCLYSATNQLIRFNFNIRIRLPQFVNNNFDQVCVCLKILK